ncbi:hypothetical protein CHELA1G11_10759 [Hyphomicrobiales bacterium]|nr:hypothetical protein CHELA1G11_10759 [Hyphomicrobiales bacterium]CAH1672443.1 hypothetical protein CHELA1G2_13547 [Hyphomicrobiales bacterium]
MAGIAGHALGIQDAVDRMVSPPAAGWVRQPNFHNDEQERRALV